MNCIYSEQWGIARHAVVCDDALGKYCREKCGWNPETPHGAACMEIRVRRAGGVLIKAKLSPEADAMLKEIIEKEEPINGGIGFYPAARD